MTTGLDFEDAGPPYSAPDWCRPVLVAGVGRSRVEDRWPIIDREGRVIGETTEHEHARSLCRALNESGRSVASVLAGRRPR